MRALTTLLERFRKSLNKDTLNKDSVISVVEGATGIKLHPEDVSLKDFVLEITSSPAKKSEIKLKENIILSEVRSQTKQNILRIFYK